MVNRLNHKTGCRNPREDWIGCPVPPIIGAETFRRAHARREILRRETEQVETTRRRMLQLTPPALERHLDGLVGKLRSGATGLVREAIRASVERILVSEDGTLTLAVKPEGLLGAQTAIAHSGCRGAGPQMEQ